MIYKIFYYVCCAIDGLGNKLYYMLGTFIKINEDRRLDVCWVYLLRSFGSKKEASQGKSLYYGFM
jgi:acyl-ACP thioesterase